MKSYIKFLLLTISFSFFVGCSEDEPTFDSNLTAGENELLIVVKGLKNNTGRVVVALTDGNENLVQTVYGVITNKQSVISIKNLPHGTYAFKYFHDENSNDNLDTNLFSIPTEGYGFSNNAVGSFGPPNFQETTFNYTGSLLKNCSITYLF